MAGAGKRFADAGYPQLKPLIPTTERRDGKKYPMVVCAMHDVEECGTGDDRQIFVIRTDYKKDIQPIIRQYYPRSQIIGVDHLTEGQACTCLLARDLIDNDQPLFIAGCDNGMMIDREKFIAASSQAEVLVFTYRHNEAVLENPKAYGWVRTDGDSDIAVGVSVKQPISDDPVNDHAIAASFWFKRGSDFVRFAEKMIAANDRINNEFYVDKVIGWCIEGGLDTRVFELDRYIGWGTPADYEGYERTLAYWRGFTHSSAFLPEAE